MSGHLFNLLGFDWVLVLVWKACSMTWHGGGRLFQQVPSKSHFHFHNFIIWFREWKRFDFDSSLKFGLAFEVCGTLFPIKAKVKQKSYARLPFLEQVSLLSKPIQSSGTDPTKGKGMGSDGNWKGNLPRRLHSFTRPVPTSKAMLWLWNKKEIIFK